MRGETHLFLSAYYFIPLVVMVLLWIASDRFSDEQQSDERKRFGMHLRSPKFILSVVICILVGSNGIYYPFLACFLLLVAGISGAVTRRHLRPLATAAILIVVTFVVLVINLAPSIVYLYKHGDAGVTHRSVAGPEIYGLKLSQLLLPISGHRVGPLNALKNRYNEQTTVTESDAAALGLIGSIGFLALLAQLFFRCQDPSSTIANLSILNLFAVLFATIGGFSSLFALFVSAAMRSNNRISVFIAFFSLLAVAIGIETFYQRRVRSRSGHIVFHVLLAFVLLAGILDQTSRGYIPNYEPLKTEFESDERFIGTNEALLPQGALVFQLPYVPFPENPKVNKMVDYDHLRGYLHSHKLRWSYGAMKNRPADLWLREIAALPVAEMVQSLAFSGFSAIYVDRNGYADKGAALEAQLREALQGSPTESADGRLVMFNLTDYNSRLYLQYSESEWQTKREQTLHKLILDWRGGFSNLESSLEKTWRWSSSEGELRIYNTSQRARQVSLEMSFVSGYEQFDDLIISGLISDQLKTNSTPVPYSKTITVPPGTSTISFVSTGRRVDAPLDPRALVFRIENFKMQELD
jgi:phosphoglycerol transferase